MVKFTLAKKEDIKKISDFISQLNSKEGSHIGYCGDDSEEIENSLKEDIIKRRYNRYYF